MNLPQLLRKLPRNTWVVFRAFSIQKTPKPPPSSSSSSSSSDSDVDVKNSNQDAVQRLNVLLQQMTSKGYSDKDPIKLAQPTNKRAKGREEKEIVTKKSLEHQVVDAAKGVAESLGGNTKQTESELLIKLLNPDEGSARLSDILKGMKIEREEKPTESKAEQVRSALAQVSAQKAYFERPVGERKARRVNSVQQFTDQSAPEQIADLFGSEPLGIFTNPANLKISSQLSMWQKLHDKELKLAVTHPPANYFQEIILWTEQGKFWQFPINNEFGLEEESKVYFTEHVFLEEHLEPWCPPKGPIRHFMELVCVGLSKNPYLTVQDKKEHIEWYRNYFDEKKALLQEVGAYPPNEAPPKNIDQQ